TEPLLQANVRISRLVGQATVGWHLMGSLSLDSRLHSNLDRSILLDAVSFRTTRPPREDDRAYSQEGMSKACNLNPSHRKVCLTSRVFLYRGRHLSRSCPRLKRLERRTKSRPIFRQHVFHLGWHFRIYLAVNHAIFFQVTQFLNQHL